MPEKIEVDGEVKEYYTPEEIEELRTKVSDLEQNANPNWNAAREEMRILKEENAKLAKFKEMGKDIDDDGNVIDKEIPMTNDKIREEARNAAVNELINERKADLLNQFDEAERPVIETYFNKLSQGETITIKNVSEFINQASILAQPNRRGSIGIGGNGDGPRPSFNQTKDFSETDEGKGLAASMGLNI